MGTLSRRRKPRQSWARRLWPFPVLGSRPFLPAENPRVGGSIPSQAKPLQQLTGIPQAALGSYLELAFRVNARRSEDAVWNQSSGDGGQGIRGIQEMDAAVAPVE